MSDSYLNIRFGSYHLQINKHKPHFYFGHNPFHDEDRKTNPNWKWFEIY